jgi:hypothetical protein
MKRATAGAGQLALLEFCMDERDRAVLAFARRHQQRRDVGDLVQRELGLSPTRYSSCCWPCSTGRESPPPTPSSSRACGRCGTGDGVDSRTIICCRDSRRSCAV